ncbi:hypothetical protein SAMD00023353_1301690 [Rosellinia necatrix]|uniref:Uncharacterized protein n=1 Tax=Rosellinia necatrix TaxID=77044 RepID=A0A1W2TC88_ROSNE|nr:hypothetical protein SAMD00023353_1301690 [Rosellinia necatrix]
MDTNYNDDLDLALSEVRNQAETTATGPSNDGRRTAPNTRRGSLVPPDAGVSLGLGRRKGGSHRERNLFSFGLKELRNEILLKEGESQVSYHEYAIFSPPDAVPDGELRSPSIMSEGEEALRMSRDAVRNGHGLDKEGNFTANPKGKRQLRGRVRQIIAPRRRASDRVAEGLGNVNDGLNLTIDDYETLGLHPATLPGLTRATTESSFWDAKKQTLYLILSFSSNPQPPYDFLSMTYSLHTKTTTALIRRSFDTRWHDEDSLNEYEQRFDSCRARWAHPLVLPIVLLQVQMLRTEEAVIANNCDVLQLEARVDAITGTTGQANAEAYKRNGPKGNSRPLHHHLRPLKRLSSLKGYFEGKYGTRDQNATAAGPVASPVASLYDPEYVPPQTIYLMKEAHDVLKDSIQLLDTLRWTEGVIKLLIQVGDELEARVGELEDKAAAKAGRRASDDDDGEGLSSDWHEIRQYLDCVWRLCASLQTDRRMSELKCRAQTDIILSLMAQEDNNLNARMAVASTRDSSSMKALAVITAIFLPGEYIGTLFGVSMFNWQKGTAGDPAAGLDAAEGLPSPTIMPSFWIYWAFTVPLTLLILSAWRGWWVNQDRYFRRHLSNELSDERYWTRDGRPRDLETTFSQDFFALFSLSGARSTTNRTVLGSRDRLRPGADDAQKQGCDLGRTASMGADQEWAGSHEGGLGRASRFRFRQVSFVTEPRQKHGASPV